MTAAGINGHTSNAARLSPIHATLAPGAGAGAPAGPTMLAWQAAAGQLADRPTAVVGQDSSVVWMLSTIRAGSRGLRRATRVAPATRTARSLSSRGRRAPEAKGVGP